ncbi:M42 family metallopeptidase [Halarsenatibacter silvermanii]|uniref:Endoglucanase n=1 Tax=Halarsenatibacter silvermanii TaxID=321763 RepID=A0A1G9NWE1_9FIRM|nr:M20/M25/M40 family metallo-hydrolase [Halarsenatibacter silvermanii]SDL90932.1 endoglucanase [Halarsenatibacter silvermanii]
MSEKIPDQKFLQKLCEMSGASGHEDDLHELLQEKFAPVTDECQVDNFGNFIARSCGSEDVDMRIMIAAHMDEIGLMVKKIDEEGFIRISAVGGIDPRTLPGQRVKIHGKEVLTGIIGSLPPHLLDRETRKNKAHKLKDLYIDTGMAADELEEVISVGNVITLDRKLEKLNGNYVSGKAFDDRAGVMMMYECAREFQKLSHASDIFFVATTQEELGYKGGITSAYDLNPEIAFAIDVTHGLMPGVDKSKAVDMDGGPVISFGPHVHPDLFKLLQDTARERDISHQIEPSSSPYGTDAAGIQIVRSGVATALLSIPLRYMHTSVETVKLDNIKHGAYLLARSIAEIDEEFVEELTCY